MNRATQIIFSLFTFISGLHAFAHEGHAKHNMVLFGEKEIFASHIVYKVPHNFQVILKVELDDKTRETYLIEKGKYPRDQFIFLLDSMDIARISERPEISGEIFRIGADDRKHIISAKVTLKQTDYSVIYFDELPLDLSSSKKAMLTFPSDLQMSSATTLGGKTPDGVVMTVGGIDRFGKVVQIKEHSCVWWDLEKTMREKCHQEGLLQCRVVSKKTVYCGVHQYCVC